MGGFKWGLGWFPSMVFFFFFFFFKVALVDVGLCWSVLLWQWLLVAIVAAVVDVPLLLLVLVMRGRR